MMLGFELSECSKVLKESTPLTLFTYTHYLTKPFSFFFFKLPQCVFKKKNTLNVNLVMDIKCLFHINLCTLYVL